MENMLMRRVGRHMPLEGAAERALRTARKIGCDAVQIFVGNPRGWAPPPERPGEVAELVAALRATELDPAIIHAAYLLNLASASAETRARSIALLAWTMQRGTALGASDVVMHIGSHGGDGLEVGIARLDEGLRAVWQAVAAPTMPHLLLENDVGAGNTIGSRFDALAQVLAAVRSDWGDRLGLCLDTAHLWGAGYDIGTPEAAQTVLDQIDATIGLHLTHVIHLNDTAVRLGGHRDLHKRLGEGIIGREGLQAFLSDPRLSHAAVILETPITTLPHSEKHDWDDDARRVAEARALTVAEMTEDAKDAK